MFVKYFGEVSRCQVSHYLMNLAVLVVLFANRYLEEIPLTLFEEALLIVLALGLGSIYHAVNESKNESKPK